MGKTCETCQKNVTEEESLECKTSCGKTFHYTCVGFNSTSVKRLTRGEKNKWVCFNCKEKSQPAPTQPVGNPDEILQIVQKIREENAAYKSDVIKKLEDFEQVMQNYSDQLSETIASNKLLHEEIKLIKQQNEILIQENVALKSQIVEIKSEMTELQQYSRRMNVQIDNMPETPNENIRDTVKNIMQTLEVDMYKNVVAVHRLPTIKKDKIKPILLQFNEVSVKEEFIKIAKKKRITSNAVNPNLDSLPVYFNDHLCSELKKLLFECKKFKKENNYEFCWTKSGKIFLRKDERSRAIRIKNQIDLLNVPK